LKILQKSVDVFKEPPSRDRTVKFVSLSVKLIELFNEQQREIQRQRLVIEVLQSVINDVY
jgi:phage tail tape-measure protein